MGALKPDTGAKLGSRKTCTVGLKSPNGLILRIMKKTEQTEQTPAGPKTFTQYVPDLEHPVLTLRGYGGAAFGQNQPYRISGQYALTNDVPVEFIETWLEQNKDHDAVRNKLIFIQGDENEAAAQGKDQVTIWDGLHPLKMHSATKDPRVPKKVRTASKRDDDDGGETLSAPNRPMAPGMLPAEPAAE